MGDQKRAVFIDRDGVIIDLQNYSNGTGMDFLSKKEDIKLIDGAIEAVKILNENNLEVIIVTNNPQVAKGLITEKEAVSINEEIKEIFFEKGARIDRIYYCPHHPKGTIEEYSIECECRKPMPGLLLKAARECNINLNESYMIGDRTSDIKAGNLAGCKQTIGVRTGYACDDGFKDAVPNVMADNLLDAVKLITKKKLKLFVNTGGEGKRLYPLTKDIPKPLVEIKGKPILHHLVDWAKEQDIEEIIMMNGYKAEKIIKYFGDGSDFGIPIKHSNESFSLGSGGPLKYAQKSVSGTSVYISGDLICEVDLNKMFDFHKKNNADITILLHKSSHPHDSDILQVDEDSRVIKFVSKHDDHTNVGDLGNAGLCIIEPNVFDLMEQGNFNFENYLYPKILEKGLKMMGYITDEKIIDIGTPERLKMIEESNFGDEQTFISMQRNTISTLPRKKCQAILLVGGLGNRLKPLTEIVPKPMVSINGRPFLEYLLEHLKKYGITNIILCVGYLGEKIENHFGDGSKFGLNIKYSYEKELLGTAGAVKNAENLIDSDYFLVANGDSFTDINFDNLFSFHNSFKPLITMAITNATNPTEQELVDINEDKTIKFYLRDTQEHKEYLNTKKDFFINSGTYIFNRKVLDFIPKGKKVSLEKEIFPNLLKNVRGFHHKGYMKDLANQKFCEEFERDIKIIGLLEIENKQAPILIQRKKISTNKIIRSRAPSRIELGGSGTDLHTYFEKNGGFVINAAINKYSYASVQNFDDGIKINFENKSTFEFPNLKSIKYEGDLDLIKAIIKKLQIENKRIFLRNDALSNSGLGTNASLAVATLGACYKIKNNPIDKHKIAEDAYQIASKELNIFGGRQNQFASSFGGINTIKFEKDGEIIVNSLRINKNTLRELEKHLVLVYVGKRVNTNEILKNQEQRASDTKQIEILDKIKENALNMKDNLGNGDITGFAECMEKEWILKKIFDPSSTTFYINHLYEVAKNNGAIGGRILGAGGGGHMLFYSKPNKEQLLTKKLQENGARIIDFGFDYNGLEVWETK